MKKVILSINDCYPKNCFSKDYRIRNYQDPIKSGSFVPNYSNHKKESFQKRSTLSPSATDIDNLE